MVRTVRSIEEEARVRRVSGPGMDTALRDPAIADALEGDTIRDLLAFASDGVRRVLAVGLEDRGRIALTMANAGLFVTVVEPDEDLIAQVRSRADADRCSLRMNFFASPYMEREFQVSGFDLAVFFSCLPRFNEPVVVLRKAARELRAGGRVFARMSVRPSLPEVSRRLDRLPRLRRVLDQAHRILIERVPGLARYLDLPECDDFVAEVREVYKVERVERRHVVAPLGAWVASALPGPLRGKAAPLVARLIEADQAILGGGYPDLASTVTIYGTKELGLGKTFRV